MITIKQFDEFLKNENLVNRFQHANCQTYDDIKMILEKSPEYIFRKCVDFDHDLQDFSFWHKIERHWMARILELTTTTPVDEYSIGPERRLAAVYKTRGLTEDRDFTKEELEIIKQHIALNYPNYYSVKEFGNRVLVFVKDLYTLEKEGE